MWVMKGRIKESLSDSFKYISNGYQFINTEKLKFGKFRKFRKISKNSEKFEKFENVEKFGKIRKIRKISKNSEDFRG